METIALIMLPVGLAGVDGEGCGVCAQFTDYLVETIALILLPVAVLMCAYALTVFIWRARAIQKKQARAPLATRFQGPPCVPGPGWPAAAGDATLPPSLWHVGSSCHTSHAAVWLLWDTSYCSLLAP